MGLSKFEQLPDEIILQICLYLRTFEIIDGFGQLNSRLNRTINQFRCNSDTHHLTLSQFQRWYKHILPSTCEYIVNLVLSNWNSPGQIYLFNQSIKTYKSLYDLFPNLKQVRLIDFSNDDIDILPKLDKIERILIDIDALKPLFSATKILLDRYLFCSNFLFKEIRLWIGENGIQLQHNTDIIINSNLEQLTMVVSKIEDLLLLFKRSPNLRKLYIEISQTSSNNLQQYSINEIMPKNLTDFHIQTNDQYALSFDALFIILIHLPTIQLLSFDIETNDRDYGDGLCWTFLISRLPNLKRLHMKIRLWIGTGITSIDVNPYIQSFLKTNLPIICYADKRVVHIDTVPYDMREFQTNMAVTTSPSARYAKITHRELYERRAYGVQLLFLCGRHEETSMKDWLYILHRFPSIQALDLTAVNIIDEINTNERLHLPRLIALRYIRSTKCQINLSFFLLLTENIHVTPRLRALTIMYGDLIYLCKRLPVYKSTRLKELLICCNDTDGRIILKDMILLLNAFPYLQTFTFLMQSSRSINRDIEQIIELILYSLTNLISFRLLCRKSSFKIPLLYDNETQERWLKRIFGLNNYDKIHLIVKKNEISIWK